MLVFIENIINQLEGKRDPQLQLEIEIAKHILNENEHVILSRGKDKITLQIENGKVGTIVEILKENDGKLTPKVNGSYKDWSGISIAALYVVQEDLKTNELSEGVKYTRQGMIKRVLDERADKAKKAAYRVELSKNIYGEHTLINEKGKSFKVTLRNFENETGYINNIDWKTNKLGTTKHIMYLFNYLKDNPEKIKKLDKTYPFIEIFTDPLNEYKITWYYPEKLENDEEELIQDFFGNKNFIDENQIESFFEFIQKSRDLERVKVRNEVFEKIESYFEAKDLEQLKENSDLDFSSLKATLYPYQKEGIQFAVFKKGVIIADEMGLGKTLQAIGTALLKKEFFNFKKTLVICPASVKSQWKDEILKFTDEKAVVIEGFPDERNELYLNDSSFFHVINYETVLRDLPTINKANYDFVILDEAQKIKNYETKTANAVNGINKKHGLVITGTPLENKLLDLYSIVSFLDPYFLSPQWEFSYQHCIFDSKHKNKIGGYYNLQSLKSRMSSLLIRREKTEVFEQLPNVIHQNVFVKLSNEQANFHAGYARAIAKILGKKFKTPFDWQKLMHLLTNMRMVCDSTFLVDKDTNISPKLIELKDILIEKLEVNKTKRKVIIFSEWVTMLKIIGDMLNKENITYTMLTGKVPIKKRGALIKEFEDNEDCTVFLSSESGGAGLNLQVADTVINFELPWNPAKKNQRIGRIDRIGQKKQKLHVFNLLSYDSIEMKIATGLLLKQNLFDGVLSESSETDEVDFSEKGKSEFIRQLEEVMLDTSFQEVGEVTVNEEEIEEALEEVLDESKVQDKEIKEVSERFDKMTVETEKQEKQTEETSIIKQKKIADLNQMEEVMTKGMEFLTGIYKMSTGNDISESGKPKVNVNKETGEVSITFKMEL
jgi:SNF2 family DNA or RNA helicase